MAKKIVLDLQDLPSERALHEYLRERLNIPEYHGHSASALWDAVYLWFEQPTVIEVKNLDKLPAPMKTAGDRVRSVFQRLDREDPSLRVVFRP